MGLNCNSPACTAHTPRRPSTRCTLALGTTSVGFCAARVTVTSASSPMGGSFCGVWLNATLAKISSVTASACGSRRKTNPARVSLARERSTMFAGNCETSPCARCWSKRTFTQILPGSTTSTTDWPATTVVPGSASRRVTMPSTGESSRRLARWRIRPSRSARARTSSWREASRLARTALREACAICYSWRLICMPSSLTERALSSCS